MSETEAETLSQLIATIYDAAFDETLWTGVLEALCAYVHAASANLFWQEATGDRLAVIHTFGQDDAYAESYRTTFSALNPLYPAATFLEIGAVYSSGDLVPHPESQATRFYREWAAPQGIVDALGANLQRYAAGAATLAMQRTVAQGYVDEGARHRFGLVVPHVRRAVLIGRELGRARLRAATLETVLGQVAAAVFLLDDAAGIDFVNPAGEAVLAAREIAQSRDGRLALLDPAADKALRQALAAAAAGQDGVPGPTQILLRDPSEALWIGHAIPLAGTRRELTARAVLGLFLRRAEMPLASGVEIAGQLHGLTPGETRVLAASLDHGTAEEIGLAMGLATSTVKSHLAALYTKTGTKRRAELVRMVAGYGAPPL